MKDTKEIMRLAITGLISMWLATFSSTSSFADRFSSTMDPKADNTKINERDQSVTEVTAQDQSSDSRDMNLTRRIRQELMKDDSLSSYARNIKIISNNGLVTLKGPVKTEFEKSGIERLVSQYVGRNSITSELEVVAKN